MQWKGQKSRVATLKRLERLNLAIRIFKNEKKKPTKIPSNTFIISEQVISIIWLKEEHLRFFNAKKAKWLSCSFTNNLSKSLKKGRIRIFHSADGNPGRREWNWRRKKEKELCLYHNAPMGGLFIGHLLHPGLSLSLIQWFSTRVPRNPWVTWKALGVPPIPYLYIF